jgi:hypothetical protein
VNIPLPDASGVVSVPAQKFLGKIAVKTLPNGAAFYRPGPDLGLALWQLAQAIYPEKFPETAPPLSAPPPAN